MIRQRGPDVDGRTSYREADVVLMRIDSATQDVREMINEPVRF